MNDVTKQLADALERLRAFINARDGRIGMDPELIYASNGAQLLMSDLKALAAYHSQQSTPCDMGEICLGCEPRREDESCPGSVATVPDGWKPVPIEPTQKMLVAAVANVTKDFDEVDADADAWRATFAAAPQPPQQLDIERLIDELSEWDRYVIEDRAHDRLEVHIRRVLAAHGIRSSQQEVKSSLTEEKISQIRKQFDIIWDASNQQG